MEMSFALCILIMIIYNFDCVRSNFSTKDSNIIKAAEDKGTSLAEYKGEELTLFPNVHFKRSFLTFADESSLPEQKRHKRNVQNETSPHTVVNNFINKDNHSDNQMLNSTEAELLPSPEAIKWLWNDRPEDSRRARIPDSIIRTKVPFNHKRRSPSRNINDDITYIVSEDDSEDNSYYRPGQTRAQAPSPRRRKASTRQRFPPDEDVYSLYSAGRPYRRRSRTRARVAAYNPPSDKDDTIIASLLSTGSEFLKMINPFNLFGSSETETPPHRYYYRESGIPRYRYSNPLREEIPEKVDNRDPYHPFREKRRPYEDKTTPKFRSRLRNEHSSDFTLDEPLTDFDYDYDDYDYKANKRKYRTKSSTQRQPDNKDPRNSIYYGDNSYAFRRKYPSYDRNYDFNFGKEKRSNDVKYSNEIFQNIDDTHTLDYLKEFPLRDDLYVAKDGNIYLKESKSHNKDLLGLDMYGMEYPEYAHESKQYFNLKTPSPRMSPVYAGSSRIPLKKSGREMNVKDIDQEIRETLSQNKFAKEKEDPFKKSDHPHSNFALKKLSPI